MRAYKTLLLLAASLWPALAQAAADKPIMAPPPDWVKPVALPAESAARDGSDEAPVRLLLSDQQVRFEDGTETAYTDLALRIQTPQGLSAGNLSFPWNPETNSLTIHKLVIHREGKTIDVLGAGQTFTVVRREPNLENATLDGMLTANIQPEGLQVGDVLEFALTITNHDPVLKGHVEEFGAAWNGVPVDRAHFALSWPTSLPLTIRQTDSLPPVKPVKAGGMSRIELSMDNVQPIIPPRGAPDRYGIGRMMEFSDFRSWADLGALMAPLYEKAAVVPADGPLRVELEKIKAASADPVKRAEAALALVQDRVRYVALLMGAGGYVPADAAETWGRRYGDCKAKTALLLALLHELGVDAEPVAANLGAGDGLDQRLPMVGLFNHVLVRAHIAGKDYWLDGTRTGDTGLARLRVPDFGWGLPLVPKNAALVRMLPAPLDAPDKEIVIEIDAHDGLSVPAPTKVTTILRGDAALGTKLALAQFTEEQRSRALRDYWKNELSEISVAKTSASYDAATGEETLSLEGTTDMDWSDGWYSPDKMGLGYDADFDRLDGPNADAPFAVAYPGYILTRATIKLPPGFADDNDVNKSAVDETIAGTSYYRASRIAGGVFTAEARTRVLAPEFPYAEAKAAEKALHALSDKRLSLRRPATLQLTEAELDVQLAKAPKTADDFFQRGRIFSMRKQWADALAAFQGAIKLDANHDFARAGVLMAYAGMNDGEAANAYAKSIDLSTINMPLLANGIARLAMEAGDTVRAAAALDRQVAIKPDDPAALMGRAEFKRQMGQKEEALTDAGAAIRLDPHQVQAYLTRANIFRSMGKGDEALAEAQALSMENPDNGYAHIVAARIFDTLGDKQRGLAEIERAIALKDDDYAAYLNRANMWPKSELAKRKADIDKAISLKPDDPEVQAATAAYFMETRDYVGAIAAFSTQIEKRPSNPWLHNQRGIAYAKAGDSKKAEADFTVARDGSVSASRLNEICYGKATAGVALDRALAECDAALAQSPEAAPILDSKGFVLLRMGKFDDAIATYDKALAKAPTLSAALFGRAVAWSRKGDQAKAQADLAAARKADPDVAETFAAYGVTP